MWFLRLFGLVCGCLIPAVLPSIFGNRPSAFSSVLNTLPPPELLGAASPLLPCVAYNSRDFPCRSGQWGQWKVFLAFRSIVPTAIVRSSRHPTKSYSLRLKLSPLPYLSYTHILIGLEPNVSVLAFPSLLSHSFFALRPFQPILFPLRVSIPTMLKLSYIVYTPQRIRLPPQLEPVSFSARRRSVE